MTGNIQEGESACIMGEYISGKDSVSLCKLSPFFCLFIKIISEINILLYDGSLSKILTLFQSKL